MTALGVAGAQALAAWPWLRATAARPPEVQPLAALPILLAEALHLPFDALREQHAMAVRAGLIRNSMLESRDFERSVAALEHASLGPFARHV